MIINVPDNTPIIQIAYFANQLGCTFKQCEPHRVELVKPETKSVVTPFRRPALSQ